MTKETSTQNETFDIESILKKKKKKKDKRFSRSLTLDKEITIRVV